DACLLVGSETLGWLSQKARDHLCRIPTVVLDPPDVECPMPAGVRIRVAVPGVHVAGTAYRMDGVPIPLRPALTCGYPTDEVVLRAIRTGDGVDAPGSSTVE